MGGHNLRCGGDDEEEDNVGGDNFYENKVAKGIIRKAYFVWYAYNFTNRRLVANDYINLSNSWEREHGSWKHQ